MPTDEALIDDTVKPHTGMTVGVESVRDGNSRDHDDAEFTMARTGNGRSRCRPHECTGQRLEASISVISITPFSCPGPCI